MVVQTIFKKHYNNNNNSVVFIFGEMFPVLEHHHIKSKSADFASLQTVESDDVRDTEGHTATIQTADLSVKILVCLISFGLQFIWGMQKVVSIMR